MISDVTAPNYTPFIHLKSSEVEGYFSYLLALIIKKLESSTDTKTLISDCLDDSKSVVERFGFKLLRENNINISRFIITERTYYENYY